jgi:hypothetical protein
MNFVKMVVPRASLKPSFKQSLQYFSKNRVGRAGFEPEAKDYESKEALRFIGKVRNGFDHWFTFVLVPGVESTNNRAERALKEPVVQRKIIGIFRNGKGTRIYETMMTLVATWKQQELNPYEVMGERLTAAWSKNN